MLNFESFVFDFKPSSTDFEPSRKEVEEGGPSPMSGKEEEEGEREGEGEGSERRVRE